jgi:hypothetical protein
MPLDGKFALEQFIERRDIRKQEEREAEQRRWSY